MTELLTPELLATVVAALGLGGGGEMWRRGRKGAAQALAESTQRRAGRIERSLDALEPLLLAVAEKVAVEERIVVEARVLLGQVDREGSTTTHPIETTQMPED